MSSGRIVLVLPGSMPFRMVASSGVLQQLCAKSGNPIIVICPDDTYREKLPASVEWRDLHRPHPLGKQSAVTRGFRSLTLRIESLLNITFPGLAYRFNEISGFQAHQFKKRMSVNRQSREELAGNFVRKSHGFPFAASQFLYRCYRAIYYRRAYIPDRFIKGFFKEAPIDLIVFWHAQNAVYRDFVHCARSQSIPMLAAIGSWDRTTTKGPLMPGVTRVFAINQVMKSDLIEYHGISEKSISVVGWPQMDSYAARGTTKEQHDRKSDFLSKYGIAPATSLVVYAANTERLGRHEPGLVSYLAQKISAGLYGENICFFLRPHPQDMKFEARFSSELKNTNVHWEDASLTSLSQLKELFLCADIVISTQGSISLDAVALDCCLINVAFDGDLNPAYDESVQRSYEMDHYQPVLNSGGIAIVRNYPELDQALSAYLGDRSLYAEGRIKLRKTMLDPFDGKSAERTVDLLLDELVATNKKV